MNFCFYSKYNGKSTIEQLRRVTFLFPPRHFILSNHRKIVPLESHKVIPPTYIGVIICEMDQVTAKSEFPLRKIGDVPFMICLLMKHFLIFQI